jgi:hypothetical protein
VPPGGTLVSVLTRTVLLAAVSVGEPAHAHARIGPSVLPSAPACLQAAGLEAEVDPEEYASKALNDGDYGDIFRCLNPAWKGYRDVRCFLDWFFQPSHARYHAICGNRVQMTKVQRRLVRNFVEPICGAFVTLRARKGATSAVMTMEDSFAKWAKIYSSNVKVKNTHKPSLPMWAKAGITIASDQEDSAPTEAPEAGC